MSTFQEFLDLLLPSKCVLCFKSGLPICRDCEAREFNSFRNTFRFDINGLAVCDYNQEVAKVIHEYKVNKQTFLAKSMATVLAPTIPISCESLVPMPSQNASFQDRGFIPAKVLANALVRQVAKTQNRLVAVADVLRFSKKVQDQASLAGQQRRDNLVGAMEMRGRCSNSEVWLIDDIVTTGATFQEAKRCLTAGGISVAGFIAFAETLPKNRQKALARGI